MSIELDAETAKCLLDDEPLDGFINILAPAKPDREVLRHDLLACYGRYCLAETGQPGLIKRQTKRLNSIRTHARKLAELLAADDADLRLISGEWPLNPERPAHLLPQLVFLLERIEIRMSDMLLRKPGENAELIQARHGISGSPLRELINRLAASYAKHSGMEAGISRHSDSPYSLHGPFLRFVRHFFEFAKIKCSDETVASYLENPEKSF